jgi:hypothetical protein
MKYLTQNPHRYDTMQPNERGMAMAYRYGNRYQFGLFPQSIEDYMAPGDPVRAYDAFVKGDILYCSCQEGKRKIIEKFYLL